MMAPKYGTCPKCGHRVPVFNYGTSAQGEVGYLTRHSVDGVVGGKDTVPVKCAGSFGYWLERDSGA